MDDSEAERMQEEQNEILDSAKQAGFPTSQKAIGTLIRLYTDHGKEALLFAIDECVKYNKLSFAYMEKICKNRASGETNSSMLDRGLEDWDT